METTRLFRFIDDAANETRHLAVALSGSESTIDQRLLTRLTENERVWQKLFDISGVAYFANGWGSPAQASAQIAILRRNIVYFKESYLSEINKAIRVLLSDTDTTSQVVRKPTLHLPTLIKAGKLSASTSVVNAAAALETAYDAWTGAIPNLRSSPKDDESLVACDAWSMYLDRLRTDFMLLAPAAKVLGAFQQARIFTYNFTAAAANLLQGPGGGSRGGFYKANFVRDLADSHYEDGPITEASTTMYYWTGTGARALPDVPFVLAKQGATYKMEIRLVAAGKAQLTDATGTTPNVATPATTTFELQDAAGVTIPGTAQRTSTATTEFVQFSWVGDVDAYLMISSVTQNFYVIKVAEIEGFGDLTISADGTSAPIVFSEPTVIDCIGGGNVRKTLQALNFNNFGNILAVVQVLSTVHGDSHLYNALNLHYQTHAQTGLDSASDLNDMIVDPLKSVDFWLGLTADCGVSKGTRQKLFKLYWAMVGDLLDLSATDGTVAEFFAGL